MDDGNWYYVNSFGNSTKIGNLEKLKEKFASNEITEKSYLWNGITVNEWTALSELPHILGAVKKQPKSNTDNGTATTELNSSVPKPKGMINCN